MASRRPIPEDQVFTLTQPSLSDSLTYQIARKQAYLTQLQAELQVLSSFSMSPPDPYVPKYEALVSSLYPSHRSSLEEEQDCLEFTLSRTAANLQTVKAKVSALEESQIYVGKQLNAMREKVERLETAGGEEELRAGYLMQMRIGWKVLRNTKMKSDADRLEKRVARKVALQASLKPLEQFSDRKKAWKDLINSRKPTLASLFRTKAQVKAQLIQLKSSVAKITKGFAEKDVLSCVLKYQKTADSVEVLSQKAQYLIAKVSEAEQEKEYLQNTLKTQLPIVEKSPKRANSVSFPSLYHEEEPKWVSYSKSSFSLILKAIDQADFNHKLGPNLNAYGLELVFLVGKKLLTAWEIATQRGKIKAKISGSRKLRNITKASILNKVVLPKNLAPVNLKQIQWEVNIMKEKMYHSHFVRDVCLPGSDLSPQMKISSSERLEGLLTGAAGLRYQVREKLKEKIGEMPVEKLETPLKDSSEEDFATSVKNSQKSRNSAIDMFTRNRTEIFRNMFSLAVNMRKKRLRTVSFGGNVRSNLEEITGVRGIDRELRDLKTKLHSLTLDQTKGSMPSLKQVYCDMAIAKKRSRICFTSKPSSRVSSPEEGLSSKLSRHSSKATDSIERRFNK